MAILKVKDPVTGNFKGIPAIKGDPGPQGPKGDPGETTGDVSEAITIFTESDERTNISTGETIKIIFGKIKKWFSDLKTVAFTGSYNDLTDAPTPVKDLGVLTDTDGVNFDEFNDNNCIAYLHNYTLSTVPNTNGIIKHYKSESSEYRYQEFTKLYNQQTYKRVYWNGVWKDWTLINSAHVEDLHNIDILAYAEELVTESVAPYFAIARGYNCTNEPYSMGVQGLGDYYYQIFKVGTGWITMYATDVRSNTVYTINKNNGVWDTSWNSLRNADTLSGISKINFTQYYPGGNDVDITDPNEKQPYIADISAEQAESIGLLENWHHLVYLPHQNPNGYGLQIAYHFDTGHPVLFRRAAGTTWGEWETMGDGCNASKLQGASKSEFLQHYNYANGIDLTSNSFVQPYSANINEAQATSIGLESSWWHLIYLPHTINSGGFGAQIAIPLNAPHHRPKYRIALDGTWQSWRPLNDNMYVQSTTPTSPQTGDIWIW